LREHALLWCERKDEDYVLERVRIAPTTSTRRKRHHGGTEDTEGARSISVSELENSVALRVLRASVVKTTLGVAAWRLACAHGDPHLL